MKRGRYFRVTGGQRQSNRRILAPRSVNCPARGWWWPMDHRQTGGFHLLKNRCGNYIKIF
jgi:hypothetical protein